jgi:hypothetical protein
MAYYYFDKCSQDNIAVLSPRFRELGFRVTYEFWVSAPIKDIVPSIDEILNGGNQVEIFHPRMGLGFDQGIRIRQIDQFLKKEDYSGSYALCSIAWDGKPFDNNSLIITYRSSQLMPFGIQTFSPQDIKHPEINSLTKYLYDLCAPTRVVDGVTQDYVVKIIGEKIFLTPSTFIPPCQTQ